MFVFPCRHVKLVRNKIQYSTIQYSTMHCAMEYNETVHKIAYTYFGKYTSEPTSNHSENKYKRIRID